MNCFRQSIVLLLAALIGSAGLSPALPTAQAGTFRIALLSDALVQGDSVLLADFLPAYVSPRTRSIAEFIALGPAPQIGSVRRFTRSAVVSALQDPRFSRESFLVPEILTARRAGHFLTQQDVFATIETALAKNSSVHLPELRPQDLTLESLIEVPQGESGLEVTQLSFDESIRRARFRLWPRNAPGTLPFYVTASVPADRSSQPPAKFVNAAEVVAGSAVLVNPRQLASLHLHSANSSMQLNVRPLQPGHLNETVRVRLTSTGRTLQAKVVATNSLDATF